MRREEALSGGWYYRQDGQTVGPVATERLKEFLTLGRLQPRQAVWTKGSHGLLFVHATTAAGETNGEAFPPSLSEPLSA
jgi:hypothetical protein